MAALDMAIEASWPASGSGTTAQSPKVIGVPSGSTSRKQLLMVSTPGASPMQ